MAVNWSEQVEYLREMVEEGVSMDVLSKEFGVSKQRIWQVMTKYGIQTLTRQRKNILRDLPPKYYWLDRMLRVKGWVRQERLDAIERMEVPDHCPALGIKLNYDGTGVEGAWSRADTSPSLDQIIPGEGYTPDNIQIISWRANRIKNDGTADEHRLIYEYMQREIARRGLTK